MEDHSGKLVVLPLSRRAVLIGMSALAATAFVPAVAVAAPPATGRVDPQGDDVEVRAPDGSTVRVPRSIGFEVASPAGGGAVTPVFRVDSRLYDIARDIVVLDVASGAVVRRLPAQITVTGNVAEIVATRSVDVPADARYGFVAGHLRPRRFPEDLLTDVVVPEHAVGPGGRVTRTPHARRGAAGAAPWGARLGAMWRPATEADSGMEVMVTVLATGPGPVAAGWGLRIEVSGDQPLPAPPRELTTSTGTAVRHTVRPGRRAGGRTADLTFRTPLDAGASLSVPLGVVAVDADRSPWLVASFLAPRADGAQRLTGEETLRLPAG